MLEGDRIMSVRRASFVLGAVLLAVPAAQADKMDKESKKWADDVKPILLSDEEKVFKDLKDKNDRDEFRKIFLARRDPDLETPENEYQSEFESARLQADQKFRVGGPGSQSDCGRVYILLGAPDAVNKTVGAEQM